MLVNVSGHSVRVGLRRRTLISDLELSFDSTRTHCIVGGNGLGKTSLLLSLAAPGILRDETRSSTRCMYFSPRERVCHEPMSLAYFSRLFSPSLDLGDWQLEVRPGRPVGVLSQGERMKLALSIADRLRPPVLLLDEPTTGLDDGGVERLRVLLGDRVEAGLITIMSSHDLTSFDMSAVRLLHLRASGERTTVVDGDLRLLSGSAQVDVDGAPPTTLTGPLIDIARRLVEIQMRSFEQ